MAECRSLATAAMWVESMGSSATAVAALTQPLTCLYVLTFTDQYTSLLQISQERVLAVAVIDDYVVAEGLVVDQFAGSTVRRSVGRSQYGTWTRRQDRQSEAVIVFVAHSFTSV